MNASDATNDKLSDTLLQDTRDILDNPVIEDGLGYLALFFNRFCTTAKKSDCTRVDATSCRHDKM